MKALFIGRFQPFHKGHLWAINKILEENDKLIIAIGVCKSSNKDPLSYSIRRSMIKKALLDEKAASKHQGRIKIIPLYDTPTDSEWLDSIAKIRFNRAYSGNRKTIRLLRKRGYTVKPIKRYRGISSTKIRRLISSGQRWEHLIPDPSVSELKQSSWLRHPR